MMANPFPVPAIIAIFMVRFMDCIKSCDFLLSDEGKAAIVQLHVDGIAAYVRSR